MVIRDFVFVSLCLNGLMELSARCYNTAGLDPPSGKTLEED